MNWTPKTLVLIAVLATAAAAQAGSLVLGTPQVEGDVVRVPINYQGDQEDVAAMDFRLNYDPAVLSPQSIEAGEAAQAADKQVQFNRTASGEQVTMVFGINQNVMQPGTVAYQTFKIIGGDAGSATTVSIANTTFASPAGVAVNSSGSTGSIPISQGSDSGETSNDDSSTSDDSTSNSDQSERDADTTKPTDDSQDDMQVAKNESDDDSSASSSVSAPSSSDAGSASSPSSTKTSAAAAATGEVYPGPASPGEDPRKSVKQLAAAASTARQAREAIPTPATQQDRAASAPSASAAQPGQPAPAGGQKPAAASPAEETSAPDTAPSDMTVAKATPTDSPEAAAADAATPSATESEAEARDVAQQAAPKASSMKFVLMAIVGAVLIAVFLVRRKLFS